MEQFKDQTRLPKFAVPKRYDLNLKLDLSVCTFSGSVHIDLSILQATKVIVLNALELVIDEVYFTNSVAQQFYPSGVVLNADDEMLILVFDETLTVGDGVLAINFSGILNEHMKGFYRGTYVDGGVNKNMAVTQFEAVDARRCFPCWDEPALKATFKITVDVPSELTALSNMPVVNEKFNGNLKTVYFEESPIMSTYLVAVVVGLFDQIEETTADGIKVSAYCPVGKSKKGKLALDIAVKSLDLYTKYFSMPYTLPKLDMVAIPDFSGGAMENYGLITFRESELLYDDKNSAAANKQRLAIVVTHEVAHQWFGNLVTMEWWTDLWLNEGFATWISYLATESLFPEWKIWSQFVIEFNGGLRMDALEQSHPIEVEIRHARSVDEIFDAISYKKGSAVIRMLQDYIGDYIFQKSLGSYMKTYACKNAKTEDLWRVIAKESGVPVDKMMETWTKQKGYPVISIKSKDHILEFEQSQFLSSGLNGDVQWIVPMTISVGPYKRRKNFLLETKTGSVDISELFKSPDGKSNSVEKANEETSGEDIWVKLNFEQAGFYRVKYEESLASQLRKAIENNWLSETDKFGILDDTFALCEACELPLSSLLTLMNVYRKEIDYIVLSKIIDVCYSVAAISIEAIPNLLKDLKQFFINVLLFSAEKLGWEPMPGESHSSRMLREQVLMALAIFGHIGTHEEAMKRFEMFLNDRNTPLLSADTRRPAYIAVMREASSTNRNGFESLLNVYREADSVLEKSRILRCLSTSSDPNIVLETLNFLFTDEVRDQDVIYVLGWISSEGREIAWTWLKENWDLILSKWGGGLLLTNFVKDIVSTLCSYEKADEVEAFFERRMNLSIVIDDLRHPLWAPPGGYGINPDWLIMRRTYEDTHGRAPPYILYLDHNHADIVLAIRGLNLAKESDYAVLLDNKLGQRKFDGGYVHNGLLKAAGWLLDAECDVLRNLVEKYANYTLTFAGHSLGSGVAALLTMVVVQNRDRLGNIDRKRVRCYAIAPARCMSLNLAVRYADVINSVVLQDDFLPRTATPLEDIFKSLFCLPCLLCLRCMRDTCIPEEKMLKDPRRLYAPGRLYHIVERKPFRMGRIPPVVKTAVPVDGRFEHIVLSCNATSDHAIIWIEREAQRALDLMLEKDQITEIPAKQRMERQETLAREHSVEYKAALQRAVTLAVPHAYSPSHYGTFDQDLEVESSSSNRSTWATSFGSVKKSSKKESWDELIERLFEKDESGHMVLKKSHTGDW